MKPSELRACCERLLNEFPSLCERATMSQTPGQDDFMRLAKVGFALTSPREWSAEDADFVDSLRMEPEPEQGRNWECYWGLAVGFFLGEFRGGKISEADLNYALAVVPGFMWEQSPRICGGPASLS